MSYYIVSHGSSTADISFTRRVKASSSEEACSLFIERYKRSLINGHMIMVKFAGTLFISKVQIEMIEDEDEEEDDQEDDYEDDDDEYWDYDEEDEDDDEYP